LERLGRSGGYASHRYGKPNKGRLKEYVDFHVTCLSDHASRDGSFDARIAMDHEALRDFFQQSSGWPFQFMWITRNSRATVAGSGRADST
jgi:hypothetical protein